MSAEENKALWRRWVEAMNKGKAAALVAMDEIFDTDFVAHGALGDIHGLDYKQHTNEAFDAFPDLQMTVDDIVAEGDKVAVRWTMTGTHTGEYVGIPPTNKKIAMWIIQIDRIVGGKIVERWTREDTLGMMQQLGAIPTPQTET